MHLLDVFFCMYKTSLVLLIAESVRALLALPLSPHPIPFPRIAQVAIVSAGSQDNATCRAECLANPNCARYSVGASCWQWGAGCIEHVDATFDSYVKEGHCPPGYALDSYGTFSCTAPGCATNNATATTVELCGAACNAASDCMAFNGGGGTCTLFSSVSGSAAGESYTVACLKAPPTLVAPFWANLNVSREGTETGIAAGYSTEGGTVYSQVSAGMRALVQSARFLSGRKDNNLYDFRKVMDRQPPTPDSRWSTDDQSKFVGSCRKGFHDKMPAAFRAIFLWAHFERE